MHEVDWASSDWDWEGTRVRGVSLASDLTLAEGFRASNVVTSGPSEEDHAVRYSDVIILVANGQYPRRVIIGEALKDIDVKEVVGFVGHVYSTKTGKVAGSKVPFTVTRETVNGDRLVTKLFLWAQRMVKSPMFSLDDQLCTMYREDNRNKWHRRCVRRSDLSASAKDHAEDFGIPRRHVASSSLRKTAATGTRLLGGDDSDVAAVGRWATNKTGRSAVASNHYDLASVTGREGRRGGKGLSVGEVLNMVPLGSTASANKVPTKVARVKAKKITSTKPRSATKRTTVTISPKSYQSKKVT
jgi:hypothetical protein